MNKTPYNAVRRFARYATDNTEEYNRLVAEGHKVIYTDRQGAEDTTTYEGCTSAAFFHADGTVCDERGIQLKMRSEACRCSACRSNNEEDCEFKHITGNDVVYYKKNLQEQAVDRERKRRDDLTKKIDMVQGILPKLHPLNQHTVGQLTALLYIMEIRATRQDGNGAPRKEDKVQALSGLTEESVQQRIDHLLEELLE